VNQPPPDEHARRAAVTYGAAADHYGLPSLAFWDRFGADTVSRLRLAPGGTVLDLCCGHGASAIAAARAVGATGRVLGVDVAGPLLELARARAAGEGLANVEFRQGDATCTGLSAGCFDAVVCVFGVFFAADMEAFIAEMWRLVRPGGVLAVTTWVRACSNPPIASSGTASARSTPHCSRRSTHGMQSPARGRWRTCSHGLAPRPRGYKPPQADIALATRTDSGTSSWDRATGPPLMPSAPSNATGSAPASSASWDHAASPPCKRTWSSGRLNGRPSRRRSMPAEHPLIRACASVGCVPATAAA
jgi:SAM-dependent methyltransferase